jgi:hypothetical protein
MSTSVARGKLLRISSEDRQVGETNSQFSVILNNVSFIQNVRGLVIKSASFKHTFPNIYVGNSTLSYSYNAIETSVTISVGWYDEIALMAALNAAFVLDPTVTGSIIMTYVDNPTPATKSFLFTSDLPLVMPGSDLNAMANIIGSTGETGLTPIMTNSPDLSGLQTVYLCSSEIAGANASASSNFGEQVPVVTEIPIDVAYGSQIVYRAKVGSLHTIIYPSERQLTKVSLSLCTRVGNVLDLKQHNLTVVFKVIGHEYFAAD